jgi:hypothetical protein
MLPLGVKLPSIVGTFHPFENIAPDILISAAAMTFISTYASQT